MGTSLAVADAAQVLLHGLAMAGQPGPRGTRSGGTSLDRLATFPTGGRSPPAPGTRGRDDDPRRIRHERVEQLDLDPDHRMETG
jgi:hypothetical protein